MSAVTTVRDDAGEMPAEFDTLDEAVAEAIRQLGGTGILAIHDADCEHDGESETSCTCIPIELRLGAKA